MFLVLSISTFACSSELFQNVTNFVLKSRVIHDFFSSNRMSNIRQIRFILPTTMIFSLFVSREQVQCGEHMFHEFWMPHRLVLTTTHNNGCLSFTVLIKKLFFLLWTLIYHDGNQLEDHRQNYVDVNNGNKQNTKGRLLFYHWKLMCSPFPRMLVTTALRRLVYEWRLQLHSAMEWANCLLLGRLVALARYQYTNSIHQSRWIFYWSMLELPKPFLNGTGVDDGSSSHSWTLSWTASGIVGIYEHKIIPFNRYFESLMMSCFCSSKLTSAFLLNVLWMGLWKCNE